MFKKVIFTSLFLLVFINFNAYANSSDSNNHINVSYTKSNSALMGKSLTIEVYAPNAETKVAACQAKLTGAKFSCEFTNLAVNAYKLKFINDLHGTIWSGNKASYANAESVNLANKFEFVHQVLNTGKALKNLQQIKKITPDSINMPDNLQSLTKAEVTDFLAQIHAKTTAENVIYLPASASSNGELKDLKYNDYLNILGLEFLPIKKGKLVIEMNNMKIGKMPFGGYAEVNIPLENIYRDSLGNIYMQYAIPSKLKETNYIKVMGAKAKISQFKLSYKIATGEFKVYIYSKDTIMFAGERVVEIFANGKGL